jgi:hypothetical protein
VEKGFGGAPAVGLNIYYEYKSIVNHFGRLFPGDDDVEKTATLFSFHSEPSVSAQM